MEGPGVRVIAEELRSLEGDRVAEAWGNSRRLDFSLLEGRRINRVFSFGKELFLGLDVFLRVHFLMYGGFSLGRLTRSREKVRLCLRASKSAYFYNCSVRLLPSPPRREWQLDILSPGWSPRRVIPLLGDADELVGDLLLNQEVFPGVGNIIRLEALFRAGVHPMSRVGHMPEETLLRLLKEVRSFALLFYRCRRARRRVAAHFLVYNRRRCPRCGGRIRRERQGARRRVSHFCPNCQRRF
jgi:endonuclease-8